MKTAFVGLKSGQTIIRGKGGLTMQREEYRWAILDCIRTVENEEALRKIYTFATHLAAASSEGGDSDARQDREASKAQTDHHRPPDAVWGDQVYYRPR